MEKAFSNRVSGVILVKNPREEIQMDYTDIIPAVFLERPNRFVARILLNGREAVCHVKNTGRCRELLTPGAAVWVQHCPAPGRKTEWDLIAVQKGERLINMDANAPNAVFGEYLRAGGLGFLPDWVKPEMQKDDSRFDFGFGYGGNTCYAEVKGVTLEENGIVRFPDAPTLRGVKHLRGLRRCVQEGHPCWVVFIVQMADVRWMEPNRVTHPEFADALREAAEAGVNLLALSCHVTETSLNAAESVEIRL